MTVPETADPEAARAGLLGSIGHEVVGPLKLGRTRQIYLTRHGGRRYVAKFWAVSGDDVPYPFRFHTRALNCLSPPASARLLVPTVTAHGSAPEAGCFVVMTYFEGVGFGDRWHYSKPTLSGGVALTESELDIALDLMSDLRDMPPDDAVAEGCKLVRAPTAAAFAARRAAEAVQTGLLDPDLARHAADIVAAWAAAHRHGPPMVSNTDFRFVNFVEAPDDRVALIDWDGGRASSFELEACCAYQVVPVAAPGAPGAAPRGRPHAVRNRPRHVPRRAFDGGRDPGPHLLRRPGPRRNPSRAA